ncbi:fibronectin type III domain protein [[Eubacterium] siraeum DSM 15702]|uniref:Fibronectin type III domain protein n=1 Tax=[Eubacterium] siraeum DSM 15702 TaxID=428128 RepID=B0MQQ1_9FIRM|nr:fibronectin type III domain protein [[Eubacterium] siraeum DSM 15702]UWP25469.1 fibronectin type III domain-containing protein [[Eubacterium] siraeum]
MKKKFVRLISAVLSAAMTLTAVPLSAFAEGEAHTHDGESNVITTPLDFREKTADENGVGWSWDYDTKTLTLDGVNIQATTEENMMSVVTVPDGTKIVLNGENTIVQTNTDDSDTYVLSAVNTDTTNCDGTMTISGNGVLNAENRSTDSMARSLGGSIILNGGTVNATGTVKTNSLEIHNDGVLNANATTASFEGVAVNVSRGITVDGNGSLTAVGCANESTLNSAILLTSNFDKISVSENGSITVPEGNAARVGIYYSGNNGDGMDAEISGGKVTAYGAKYGIYKVNLIMSGTGSVYTTGGSYAIGQTSPEIDMDELIVRGSADFKAEESAVTGEVELKDGYYEIGGADAKTVVIKPDTSPRIILGKQTGIFKTEEYEIIEGMTDTKLKGTVYFDITLKNMSDEEFADARGYFGGDEPDLSASIIKTDYGWVCMVCDTEFSVTYDTDNTLTIKCGDIVSNTVQVKSNANRFNKVTQGDNTNRTVFYTNTSQEEKDNYKLVSTYTVDSESISYNWYSTNSAYSADELGAAVSGSNGEFKLADNIPAGNYVLYCDITYSDGDSTETVTEKFTFTYKECAHENGYSDGKCTNCGALCDHSNIDIDTGKCNECAHQFVATISTDGSAPTGYDTLADCLDSITADTGNYVKIYQDIGDASATAALDTIDVNHNVMIDLNGRKLNNIKLGVNKDVTLTLTGTAGSYVKQVYVRKGGSFIIDSVANVEFDTIFVEAGAGLAVNDGAKVTTASLTVKASVNDDGTTTTSVKLATGMKIGGLTYWRQDGSGLLKLGNLLDVTRQALQYDESGEYHDLYKEFVSKGLPVALTVVEHTDADHKYGSGTGRCEKCGKPCEHGGDINTDTGICSICGAVVSVAIYTSADGNLSSYLDADELHSLLNEYNGSGTIKLFKDYSKPSAQYDLYGELTIDVNGRQFNIRSITPCKNGKLTIKNSGNPVMLGCNVYPTNDASYAGGTLIIDGDVVLDTSIYVYDSSTVILKDGAYTAGLYARDSKTLYDMLGEGKAFFKTDGTLFNASVKEISSSETLTVKAHSHTYVDGKCGCGYVCPHSDVDSKTGKCNECEYQYAAVIVKDGAVASVYKETEMGAAFETADSDANTGCTLKVYKNYTGSYTTLSGKFTLWIAEKANVGTLTVSGDITVTGSGKSNSFYGDFDVANGGKLTFDENCGAMGTVSVGAGTFDCYCSIGITLNINDASSDVILHGGSFRKICYNGGGDRANAEILTLLAENRMFMKYPNAEPIDGSKTLLKDGLATVFVASHEDHSYDSTTGKCTICGKRCGHTDVDSKTGVCLTCEYQLTAGVSGVGTAKYFDNIDDAFTAALSEENSGCTLTLYKHCEITQSVEIGQATVTVDVNGYSLGGEADISVNNGGVLYLKDSRKSTYYGCIDAPFSVNGGTLINGTADGGSSAADVLNLVINSAKCVEIYGGIFENVYIAHASGVALYGGRYNTICGEESNSTPVNDLLAKGYAFATLNSVTHLPESIVDGSAKTIGDGLTNVMVVAHEHRYNVETGKCPCGVCALAIFTETTQSSETYTFIESETQFKNIAENEADGVLKLTGDVDCIVKGIIINGNKTIDMNGHTLNVSVGTEEISAVAVYGNVTFENSGSSRAVINATGVYSYGMVTVNGDIEFDTFAIFEDGDALINAGVFKSIYVQGRSVIEILGSGKALASESGEILNASVQQIYRAGDNMFVTAHPKHTYDDHGNCACGYKCLHDGEGQVDEDSANKVCSECGAKIYAKVTTADGKVKYFDDITEGLRYADKAENKGCVFTLVTSGKINSGVTLSSGQFTIATATTNNNYVLGPYAGKITIDGADVIAEGDMEIRCKVNVKSGSLTLPEGSSAGFDSIAISGGTVTISEGVNADSYVGADNLFVSEDATDAKLTIGGGTYGNINLGQFKLKDVIASGVRVISYDNPTDPTAEKTAKALLYSDIAEKNNFDSENGTVSYYLVTKCEHKNEDGSYAFNDGVCKYCNSEFAASVSYTVDGSAKTELFGDIYDAFDKANEIGTATVTLYKDITDKCTQEITVMGNVTLELNGKTLGGRYGIARIPVSDGGTLTVNGDGDMDTPIYVNENSKLVINGGGYFNSVSVKKGGNAEIGGGTIRGLSVRGNVKLSGGKFNDIEILNGNLESVLADGYAYKVDGGAWLSIAERAESVYSSLNNNDKPLSVEEAPIKSASIAWHGGGTPVVYRNGAKNLDVNVTYELADASKQITYSDYVNGNNRSKDSEFSDNWYRVLGYEIGDIITEDGEVEYYTVLKCDGYEYKSNVLKLTLATCSHPEERFLYNNNGWVTCGICDLGIDAQVIKADGEPLGYADMNTALKLAQENEGSTVKLMSLTSASTLTVTGGKFTVDFNGKKVRHSFDVNGGDVTFTSSAEKADAENLQSTIKVNGADAKVTIDGKIKLKRVRTLSGTLTVNSTDGYIDELSTEGGKTVIDGARIGALRTFGGEAVINDVNADSLTMCDNRSGESEYNISIVSGRFGSFTCNADSGYTLGMAIASGSVVFGNSMNGITVYTYEAIQTMTKTDRIFVEKCVHKDGSGSYVLDGNPCPYCNEEIVATVSYTANGGEETDLFSDIYDAFAKANEVGTATVTLQKNITDDITDTIAVTGNVTLELNGKRLSQPGTDVWYSIEVTSGKLTANGSGLIKRVAVRNSGDAEINGGTFSDFIIKDGGNAVIKGGQFYSLQVYGEGRNVGQLLADGYAYWSFIDSGIWSTIAEREKQDIANVEVKEAPIKSATATANKTVLYRNGGGARQISFKFNVKTSDGYTVSDANKVTVGLYVGDTLIRESDFGGNSSTFANASEISDTDGTVKAHLVIKLNGYEYVTNDVEFEIATCTHPYDALTTDEYDYYRCSLCDAGINAILVKTNGDKACYTDNVPEAFESAQLEENNGCTLELYRGVNRDCEITQGSFTVLFKKTGSASAVIKVSGGNVKITGDDGCTLSKYPGSSVGYLIAVTGGTVTFDDITINDDSISVSGGKTVINGGTYNKLSVSGGTVTINSGTFSSIDVSAEGKALKDLLGENKAFATSDGKLFDASKVSESDNSLTVIDHSKHEYDETGRCGCGYQCAHSEINAEGVCNECNAKMYAAVTVKSETGTTVKYFTKLTEAFEFAAKNENKGCTLKMLRDFFDRNTDINVNGGKLTVDMNGFGVYINSFNGSGTQITIRSDSKCTFGVENGFSMDGGTVTFSGEVSVVCQNVKLNATYFSSYVETLKIDTLILEDGVLLKQLASITNANIANIDCSSEIYLYQILASGSRVDSQLYSALKANASSNFDNVRIIRCDHPDGVGRDNRCIYCNSLIAASVSYTENGAEKTEYFVKEDLGKAFAKANSVASATITMLMSSVYDTDYLPVTGDVTLIANGDNAILYNTVKVADGGKLTLRGNANIFAVIAEPGSRLTAEEATRIAYLTVNGGDVKLSGGQYDNITVKDGKITDILGNGYAYKKTEGGAWLTLKEREMSEASGVTVAKAPIVQATLSTEINKLYRNSNANPTLKFNLALAHGSNLNDSYVSKRYGINSYVSGDIIYSSLSALVKDAKLSADEIIDKAGDSDVAEIYYVVTTDDGYEIKSNTVSIDLVDCDHSQVVDPTAVEGNGGNITKPTYCEICESKFNAKITKGDDVKYYNDLDEAAKDAQKSENEGCTLYPLYNKNGYGGQLVITEGNFTLKYAVRTAFSRPIIINGKAKLTVTGRCAVTAFENQDAFIVRGGDVTFDGLATGSNVTINGGNVTMAANNINCLTIHGGNVSISSGGFAEIVTTVSDKVIADYIDHGFWVQDRGTKEWIDIYSLNKATASSTSGLTVRLCPMQIIKPIDTVYYTNGYYPDGIPSLQISAVPWYSGEVDAKVAYQWIAIDENGNETEIEGATDRKLSLENLTTGRYYCRLTYSNAATAGVSMASDVVTATITECEHSGGEATCTEKAKCEICGAEYGEPLGHDYVVIKVVEPDYRNEGYSVFECTRCKDSYIGNRVPVKPIPDVEEIAVEKTTYNEVDISWKNISGVDGYYVECYVGNQWKQINCSADGDRVAAKLSGLSAGLKYKVRIAAYAGSFTGKFRCFYVDTVPSPVWNINTVKATDETVRISWSRNTRADGYKVEWYIDNQWSAKTVTGNNNISAVIDGLCAGTRYKVRVSAYKGDLYSPYTYGYIDTLPSKVTGITQTVTSSSFTLKWDKNESADGYTVQYYADGKWNEKTLTGNNKTTVTIGSLKGYKTYKVRIKAYKGELQSTFDDIYITTAPTKVSGLKVKSAVDSKAVVIWNADANADGYNVGYYIGGKWVEKTITDNKTAMAVLGGLTPYSTYKVRVRAYKGNLYGDYSYTTVTAVLSPVTDIKVVSAKSNSITVKWGKNASADGYKVEIYKGGKWVKKTLKGSTNATVTIGGLRAGSVYKVRIASYKGANTSAYTYANVNTAK